jgi:hypothetical protein
MRCLAVEVQRGRGRWITDKVHLSFIAPVFTAKVRLAFLFNANACLSLPHIVNRFLPSAAILAVYWVSRHGHTIYPRKTDHPRDPSLVLHQFVDN